MKEEMKVTPWEVRGEIDYNRIIKDFGIRPIDQALLDRLKKHTKDIHYLLRRKIMFAHRDLNWILDEYEKGNKFFLYTGRAPSGDVHLGHLLPWIFTKWLQDKFKVELWFQFPDEEKFLFKENLTLKETEFYLQKNMLDVIALGFDPKLTKFLIDTKHASLMYKEAIKVAKKITFSTAKSVFGFTNDANIGSIFYTAMQAVPAFLPSVLRKKNIPCLIPLGVDQDPHFRVARDVMPKLGYYKPAIIHSKFFPSLSSTRKMSSSEPQDTISTTDTKEMVEQKISKAFTGQQPTKELQKKLGGNPDVCSVCQYYRFMFETDDKKLTEIFRREKEGEILAGEHKEDLTKRINAFLTEHQRKRKQAEGIIDKFVYSD